MTIDSIERLWRRCRASHPDLPAEAPSAEHFCDTAAAADRCADLIVAGVKQATASALVEYQTAGDPIPAPGKLTIITDWSGEARAIIRTTSVTVHRFGDVPAGFAAREGEGDGSLAWWREAHASFWTRTLTGTGAVVDDDFLVVCEEFEVVTR